MGRLFWKLFLAFQLAFVLAGMGVGTALWLHQRSNGDNFRRLPGRDPGHVFVDAASATLRNGGVAALRALLQEWANSDHPTIYAVDENSHDLLGRPLPPEATTSSRLRVDHGAGKQLWLFSVSPRSGINPPPTKDGRPLPPEPPPPYIPITAGIVASLIFSSWLAWYLAKPVRHLRRAFGSLAAGKLDTRIAASMGHRRDEIADLGQDFDDMAGQIANLVDAHRRLLHDVSHELRSPLARLQAAVGLLRQQPGDFEKYLGRVEKEADRVNELVGELLTLSRLEAGLPGGDGFEEFDLAEMLEEIVDDARFEAGARDIRIRLETPSSLMFTGQIELIHRAMENVIRNAIRHSPNGYQVRVVLASDQLKKQWSLLVQDAGSGVPEAELSAIFQPFFRATGHQHKEGIGLGLAIARLAVERHRGTISASNRDQGGLRVEICVPLAQDEKI
jgi:two-component system OmpR family sensor kinase